MLCEICHQREATIHLKQTRQGKSTDYHLCEQCVSEQNLGQQMKGYLDQILASTPLAVGNIFIPAGGIPEFGQSGGQQLTCSTCGLSYQEFRKTGLFGCSHCYEAFAERLDPVFRRVQGNIRHQGKQLSGHQADGSGVADQKASPELAGQSASANEITQIQALRDRLKSAVKKEDYETAASLRDEIHALEAKSDPAKEEQA